MAPPFRAFAVLAVLLVAATALAGCHGLNDGAGGGNGTSPTPTGTGSPSPNATTTPTPTGTGSPSPTPTGTPDPEPERLSVTLTPVDAPSNVTVNATINITVDVTGDAGSTTHAGAHFSYNTTGNMSAENLTPDDFDGATPHVDSLTFPGNYTITNWTITDNRTLFVRAHMLVDGEHYWSDEFIIAVNDPEDDPPTSEFKVVFIQGVGQSATCPVDYYNQQTGTVPSNATNLNVHGKIQWTNNGGCAHTATFTSGPVPFDTGGIEVGEDSAPIQFDVVGTYFYECAFHPETMKGRINVVEPTA